MLKKRKVLFLCTGNSARSQMAEAYLRKIGADSFEPYSAGLEPKGINPFTEKVLAEEGISLEGQWSKGVEEYLGKTHFNVIITVCSNAEANCPAVFLNMGEHLHWNFEDPAAFEGSDIEKLDKFRDIRSQIETKLTEWVKEID